MSDLDRCDECGILHPVSLVKLDPLTPTGEPLTLCGVCAGPLFERSEPAPTKKTSRRQPPKQSAPRAASTAEGLGHDGVTRHDE